MSGFMGNLRGGADKAAFEAKKFARIQAEQLKLGKERSQRTAQVQMLGEAAWELYQEGRITEPKLLDICLLIQQTTAEIARLEEVIEAIRQEQPPRCPNCGRDLKPTDQFCANCGTRAPWATAPAPATSAPTEAASAGAATPQPAPQPPAPPQPNAPQPNAPQVAAPQNAPAPSICPQCGHTVRAGAAFCGRCGHRMAA